MLFSKRTDAELMAGIRAGGSLRRSTENHLYDQYRYLIREASFKHKLTPEDCASAYSDALLTVIEHIASGRFEGRSGIKTYLYQIFSNKCVDLLRKNTTNRANVYDTLPLDDFPLADETRNAIQRMMIQGDIHVLRQRLTELGDKCRQMVLAWGEGFSDEEIAQELGYHSSAVAKTSRLRCLERLRNLYMGSIKK
ncbi:MAG: sigma-70 family RNA polymerase sigma factor [Siphonobacter sp.]